MQDASELDKKYFIDQIVYNCPFCNRRHLRYSVISIFEFDWTNNKQCFGFITRCNSCLKKSIHLSYEELIESFHYHGNTSLRYTISENTDIDSKIFYSQPTSFFTIDDRIPKKLRELISESEGCVKSNFLTGASACIRKAIYELLVSENCTEENYKDKIKSLKHKYPNISPLYFDVLSSIQISTSNIVHESSWESWDPSHLKLLIETLKLILYEIFVYPAIKQSKLIEVQRLREKSQAKI